MKRGIAILTLLLVLIFREIYRLPPVEISLVYHAILKDSKFIIDAPGLGWIEDRDYIDSKVILPRLPVSLDNERFLTCAEVQEHFGFLSHDHLNPLLIDRPPPAADS